MVVFAIFKQYDDILDESVHLSADKNWLGAKEHLWEVMAVATYYLLLRLSTLLVTMFFSYI